MKDNIYVLGVNRKPTKAVIPFLIFSISLLLKILRFSNSLSRVLVNLLTCDEDISVPHKASVIFVTFRVP